jgi:hypothetical protein
MGASLASITAKAQAKLKDAASKLQTADWTAAIAAAVLEYSRARPRMLAEAVIGADAFDYLLDGDTPKLTAWQDAFSRIDSILYPYTEGERGNPELERTAYSVLHLPAGLTLRFTEHTPSSSESFLVTYTTPHTLSESASTHPAADDEALSDIAAACGADILTGYYTQSTDSSLSGDVVNRLTKAQEYRALAKEWRARAEQRMGGASSDETPPAGGTCGQIDTRFTNPQRDARFFHGRHGRTR